MRSEPKKPRRLSAQPRRTFAIGDIHGCYVALRTLLDELRCDSDDLIVFLGDLVDRGPDSYRVVETVRELVQSGRAICMLGNHEQMALDAQESAENLRFWLQVGGAQTLESYKTQTGLLAVDPAHLAFFREDCLPFFEDEEYLYAHACIDPAVPMPEQSQHDLQWTKWFDQGPHFSGKTIVLGHTTRRDGRPLDVAHTVCIDTFCFGGGWLTGFETTSGTFHQANEKGERQSFARAR